MEIVAETDQMELNKATNSRWAIQDATSEMVSVKHVQVGWYAWRKTSCAIWPWKLSLWLATQHTTLIALNSISFFQRNEAVIVLGPAVADNMTGDSDVGEEEVLVTTSTGRPINRAPDTYNEQVSYYRGAGRASKFATENKGFSGNWSRPY